MPTLLRGGQRVVYSALGSGPNTVLLVHNLLSQRGSFAEVASHLAHRCRAVAVDLRGHGESGGAPRAFSVHDLAGDLVAVMDALAVERAVLVGTSLGATVSALVALEQPSRVAGLVLMSATPHAASARDRLRFASLATVLRTLGPGPVMPAILGQLLGATYRARAPEEVAATAAQIRATARRDLAWAVRAWTGRPELTGRLRMIEAPTRVVIGAEDSACPRRFGEAIAAEVPGATLHVIAGSGHSVQLEQAAAVAAVIDGLLGQLST
jgi:pimeloyl-ACP methyl ester carboxylesterase